MKFPFKGFFSTCEQIRRKLWICSDIRCVKSVRIPSYSGPYFPVFSPNGGKYGHD